MRIKIASMTRDENDVQFEDKLHLKNGQNFRNFHDVLKEEMHKKNLYYRMLNKNKKKDYLYQRGEQLNKYRTELLYKFKLKDIDLDRNQAEEGTKKSLRKRLRRKYGLRQSTFGVEEDEEHRSRPHKLINLTYDERLRWEQRVKSDFSHQKKKIEEELREVEEYVDRQKMIRTPLNKVRIQTLRQAKEFKAEAVLLPKIKLRNRMELLSQRDKSAPSLRVRSDGGDATPRMIHDRVSAIITKPNFETKADEILLKNKKSRSRDSSPFRRAAIPPVPKIKLQFDRKLEIFHTEAHFSTFYKPRVSELGDSNFVLETE
mmetsp:Transcript_48038/g.55350  ORF Transcript_48038/g.55350 Transcript_48038/m.55350 type:complete len:316 (+) Transcript_48038:72-1019(+)